MAAQTETQRKATARKAAATRRRNAAQRSTTAARSSAKRTQTAAAKAAETRVKAELNTLQVVQAQAERAVLIPVGAALPARDAVVEVTKPYVAGRDSAEKEIEKTLKKFERRGSTARNRAVRETKKTRTRVERELRQRRNGVVKTVKQNRREFERQVKATRREVQGQAEGIVSRVGSIA